MNCDHVHELCVTLLLTRDVTLLQMLDAFFYARDDIPVFRDMASAVIQKTCVGRNLTDHRQRLSKQKATELFLMGYRDVLPGFTSGFKHIVENSDFTVRSQTNCLCQVHLIAHSRCCRLAAALPHHRC